MASFALPPAKFTNSGVFVQTQIKTKSKVPPESTSFANHTAIITGSNVGIGLETCRVMLGYGLSHLIMGVRTVAKGEKASESLRQAYPKARIEVWALDMASYDSVQAFAKRCDALTRLDTVILNAAVFQGEFVLSPAGHEESFQVNYLSTALLSILLLPILKAKSPPGTPGRLTMVSSGVALTAQFPDNKTIPIIPSFDVSKNWNVAAATVRYSTTKLLELVILQKLSEIVSPDDVIITAVDPGFTGGSGLHRNLAAPARAIFGLIKIFTARSPKEAAWIYLDAAAVRGKESHGGFIVNWDIYP